MDIFTNAIDTAVNFTKDTFNKVMDIWNSFDEDKKKLYIGCAIAVTCVLVVACVAYGIGTAHGRKVALEEDDF